MSSLAFFSVVLHLLPIRHRVSYKIAELTFKALHVDLSPTHLQQCVQVYEPAGQFSLQAATLLFSTDLVVCCNMLLIDNFRGACAVKGNVQVAGHVNRVDHGDAFNA